MLTREMSETTTDYVEAQRTIDALLDEAVKHELRGAVLYPVVLAVTSMADAGTLDQIIRYMEDFARRHDPRWRLGAELLKAHRRIMETEP